MTEPWKKVGNRDFRITLVIVVLVGVMAIGIGVYIRLVAPEDDGSYIPGNQEITPEIELLRDYLRIDTTSGREIDGARFLARYLEEHGIEHELIESGPGKASVYSRIDGTSGGDEGLLLLSHIDVLPADPDEWTHPPFGGEISLNRIWGRGALDMKGTTITQLLAFVELAKSEERPTRDVVFLATPDEETGSQQGLLWLKENRPDVISGVDVVITEGGLTETIRDQLVLFSVEVGGKNLVRARARSRNLEALEQFREVIEEEEGIRPEIERLLPGVDEYLKSIADYRVRGGAILSDVRSAEERGELSGLGSNYLELLQDFAIVEGNIETSGDGTHEFRFVLSLLPDTDLSDFVARLRERAEPEVEIRIEASYFTRPTPLSSTDSEMFAILEKVVADTWGESVETAPHVMIKTTTDCRFLRSERVACYGLWPFQVSAFESLGIHAHDERLKLDWFVEGVGFMEKVVREYARIDE